MKFLILVVSLTFATPSVAIIAAPADIEDCIAYDFGTDDCPMAGVRTLFYRVTSPGYWRQFHDIGMESFAMSFVFSQLSVGIDNRGSVDDCVVNDETVMVAEDVWYFYVQPPENMSEGMSITFSQIDQLRQKAIEYIAKGAC